MGTIEARVRVRWQDDRSFCLDVAVGDGAKWSDINCTEPQEAYTILYINRYGRGRIFEAIYDGESVAFKLKKDINDVPLIPIPPSIINTAFNFSSPQYYFKPLTQKDLKYIKDNCHSP
mgnify:FL=1